MKILLIGEYSRLHNSLKEGLIKLGHDVTLLSDGDGFKDYPSDIKLKQKYVKGPLNLIRKGLYYLFKIDLKSLSIEKQFKSYKHQLVGYDIVQLINEKAFHTIPKIEKRLLKFIFENNENVFLLSCGCDFPSVDYAMKKKLRYSILTPYFKKKIETKKFYPVLMYLEDSHKKLHDYIYQNIKGVIASDIDYHLPLINHPKYLGLIPNPINSDEIKYIENPIRDKIIIFHGINSANYYKKGNDLFEAALNEIQLKFKDKVDIIITTDIPYKDYIILYDKAHILMDQIYAYDQGYNALEAMAKGKVTFTGAEQEWLDHYNLKADTVAINALPDVIKITESLSWLIDNPKIIEEISKNAHQFIKKEHNYINIAQKYLDIWSSKTKI